MKSLRKIMALLIAMVMVFAMSITAFAYDVTITPNAEDKGTHTYGAYQIFKGNLNVEDGTLGNIEWGSGISAEGKTALGDAAEYAKTMTDANADDKAAELAQYLTTAEKTGSAKIEGLVGGYYLIKDESAPTGNSPSAQTKFILKVVKNEIVNVKSSVPSVEKKVQDINDSDENPTLSDLQDSADYDIGDTIPYTITGTIGSGIANFTSYSFQFVDTMSKGLTLDQNSWDIKVGDKSIKSSFTLTSALADNGATTWTWAATDIKSEISDGTKVVLTYNAVLNSDAVIGSAGNPNTVTLKFDNNPNNSGKGQPKGTTPEDTNIVFTYKTVFNKTDGTKALTGADFTLEKKVNDQWVDVTALNKGEGAVNPTKTGSTAGSTFEFAGLDDGDYRLTETTTPAGYNTIDPIEFTITAEHDILSDNPTLKSLTGTGGAQFNMTADVTAGTLTSEVVNNQGSTLPSTGGMGTTLFYIVGGILVAGAAIILIAKRKVNA